MIMKTTLLSITLFFGLITISTTNVSGQVSNPNSLVSCVDHFTNIYNSRMNSMTEEQKQNITDPFLSGPLSSQIVTIKACALSYEHTGKYMNLLPIEEQINYGNLAAQTIFFEGLSIFIK